MPKKTPRQIHKQYDKPDHPFQLAITQQYVKVAEEWKFAGYKCVACKHTFKFQNSLLKHENTCKVLNKLKGKEDADTTNNTEG